MSERSKQEVTKFIALAYEDFYLQGDKNISKRYMRFETYRYTSLSDKDIEAHIVFFVLHCACQRTDSVGGVEHDKIITLSLSISSKDVTGGEERKGYGQACRCHVYKVKPSEMVTARAAIKPSQFQESDEKTAKSKSLNLTEASKNAQL
ncbi:hypothetical protein RRG08_018341 [Elysia crispata]|uniref:Uncharacterized protein n=1 Tax=Elysia crispata TaxID=231223 RepID=A0AAE1CQF7_9GAST|nr:hypothetical protein RRG08_018341 [Elysia crispata]